MIKKYFRYLLRIISVLFICVLIYLVYIIFWIRNFNVEQSKAVENINVEFHQTFPIIRDPNGYFGVIATVNGQYVDMLIHSYSTHRHLLHLQSKRLLTDTRQNIGNENLCQHLTSTNKSISQNYIK